MKLILTRMTEAVKNEMSLNLSKCEVGGRTVAFLTGGEGPLILFLHGWAVTPYVYKAALELVARTGNRVIAPFLPGFGPSESFGGSWPSPLGLSEWIEAFLDAAGEDRPTAVVGHSLGGGIATSYAAHFPGQIERLFLLSSVGGHANLAEGVAQSRTALEWSLSIPLDLLASEASYSHLITMVGTGMIQLLRDPIGLWRLSRIARNYALFNELEWIVESDTRIFVIGAVSDRVITREAVQKLANYASVEPIWVSGTHSWISTHPHKFVEVLTTYR